jgi:hypothetical protein
MRALDSDETATEPSPGLPHPAMVDEPTSNMVTNAHRDERPRFLHETIMGYSSPALMNTLSSQDRPDYFKAILFSTSSIDKIVFWIPTN